MISGQPGIFAIGDAATRYSTPLTGAYYFVPSVQALHNFTTSEDD